MWGQLLAVTVGCSAVADDLTRGAFQFYFARPLRPGDYLRGKLLGVGLIIALPMLLGPFILTLVRLFLVEDVADMLPLLPMVPKALLAGLYGTASIVMPSVALVFDSASAARTPCSSVKLIARISRCSPV